MLMKQKCIYQLVLEDVMAGNEMQYRENTSQIHKEIYLLFKQANIIQDCLINDMLCAIHAIERQNGAIYLGRIHDSRTYRISCNPNDDGFKLVFKNYEERNRFASAFESLCRELSLPFYKYF